jgi:stage V sporulation protein G
VRDGLLLVMPNKKLNGECKDIAHPITAEFRQAIEGAVLTAYLKAAADWAVTL